MSDLNILKYFSENNFRESLVIKYSYRTNAITLVCAYAGDVVKAILAGHKPPPLDERPYHRDLRKLDFAQVVNYEWKAGSNKSLPDFKDDYDISLHKRSVTIRQIEIAAQEDITMPYQARISFGDYGRCRFEFMHFEVKQRLIRSTGKLEDSNEDKYIDIKDNKPVDFYNPFE